MSQTQTLLRLATFIATHDPEMPMTRLQIFLLIASRRHCLVRDLTKLTGLNQSTVARSLASLGSKPSRSRQEGLNWITMTPDPEDPRRMIVGLSSKGSAILQQLNLMLE